MPGGGQVWSVGRLTRHIRGLLENSLKHLSVQGEISNLRKAGSGHIYFTLKDAEAQVRCVMFRNVAETLKFTPEEGLAVVLRGRLGVYEARGEYQIVVTGMEPEGIGALQLAFEQLKARLEADGLFDPAHKKSIPFLPKAIGVVTSPTGAAIRDILQILNRRFPTIPVLIAPARVQGDGAAVEIAQGIATLNKLAATQAIEVIIVGRGGGSAEDLWAFNEEPVARAIFASKVPVVSAVGHEIDFSIADFVADLRAPTPSAAAELVVPNRTDLRYTVETLRGQIKVRLKNHLQLFLERWQHLKKRLDSPENAIRQMTLRNDDLRERLDGAFQNAFGRAVKQEQNASVRLRLARPDRFHHLHRQAVKAGAERLRPALKRYLKNMGERLITQNELLDSLSPLKVMSRGFAVVSDEKGKAVTSVQGVKPGDTLSLRLKDGTLETETKTVKEEKN